MSRTRWLLAAAALIPLLSQASPITYDFTVTATSGSLSGQTASGFLTFDSSIVPTGDGAVIQAGLFTDFSFTWDGVTYDETTANTGFMTFDAAGTVTGVNFGTNCNGSGGCGVTANTRNWNVFFGEFIYARLGELVYGGTASLSLRSGQVPEPASLALAGLALAAAAATSRARRWAPGRQG